jgi:hypothetical protein
LKTTASRSRQSSSAGENQRFESKLLFSGFIVFSGTRFFRKPTSHSIKINICGPHRHLGIQGLQVSNKL